MYRLSTEVMSSPQLQARGRITLMSTPQLQARGRITLMSTPQLQARGRITLILGHELFSLLKSLRLM